MHAIRVNWFEKGGEEVLALDWAGPGVKSGGIDKAIVMTADGGSVPVEQEVVEADPDKFVFDPSLVGRGRELFSSLGCAACHLKTDQGKPVPSGVTAPSLVDCSAGKGCLSAEAAAMIPNYELTPIQQTAVETAIRQGAKAGDKSCRDRGDIGPLDGRT